MDDEMLETLTPEDMLAEMLEQLLDFSNELLTANDKITEKLEEMLVLNKKLHAINRKVFNYVQMREQEATRVETETKVQ